MFVPNFHYESLILDQGRWHNPQLILQQLPPKLQHAVQIKGSLTQYIETQSQQKMQVDVLKESWDRPLPYECRALNLKPRELAWIRQVTLSVDGRRWVYARSVIPRSSLQGQWKLLKHLKQKPLGSLLFKRQKINRGVISVGHVHLPMLDPSWGLSVEDKRSLLWARYSAFTKNTEIDEQIQSKKMLVSEYFLDDFMCL